jgi:hypothetical protein
MNLSYRMLPYSTLKHNYCATVHVFERKREQQPQNHVPKWPILLNGDYFHNDMLSNKNSEKIAHITEYAISVHGFGAIANLRPLKWG